MSYDRESGFKLPPPVVITETYTDDLHLLTAILPATLQAAIASLPPQDLLEIVLDLGRRPQARLQNRVVTLCEQAVGHVDLERCIAAVGEFSADNRAGIEGTLHRISALRNRRGQIIGLTLRVGRAVYGTIDLIRDLMERNNSVLLLGPPGVGKTTKLREIARVLADEAGKRVMVIDTSNEIAGDGDIPHPAIGSARRMQVPHPELQHALMIEAVENHMPEVIIVDEIGTANEALAARTIAERGVQLIGTAHGTSLENLLQNPTLADLVGGVQTVTLGDDEARLRGSQKTINERKTYPTFEAVVEIVNRDEVMVHADTAAAVDKLLRNVSAEGIRRSVRDAVILPALPQSSMPLSARPQTVDNASRTSRIYPYAISPDALQRVIRDLQIDARVVKQPERATCIVALRSRSEDVRLRRLIEHTGLPLHVVKRNTTSQLRRLLQNVFNLVWGVEDDAVDAAMRDAEDGVRRARQEGTPVELAPQTASLRKLQHRLIARNQLVAESVGCEPSRHLVIRPA